MPGVVKVFTYDTLGLEAGVPCASNPFGNADPAQAADPGRGQGAHGRRAGRAGRRRDGQATARDAADRVVVDYEPAARRDRRRERGQARMRRSCTRRRPAITASRSSTRPRASTRSFDAAPVKVSLTIDNQRLTPVPIEPRGVVADWISSSGELTFYTSTQVPHFVRTFVAAICGIPESKVRVDRARRRRRLRLEDRRLRRGVRARAGLAPRRAGRSSGSRRAPSTWSRPSTARDQLQTADARGRRATAACCALRVHLLQDCGAYLGLLTPSDRAPDRDHGAGRVRAPARRHHARRGLHEHDADRRLPRRRAARGDAPDRAAGRPRSPTSSASIRPRCGGATSPPSSRTPRPPGLLVRLRRLRRARSTRRSSCPTTPASRRAAARPPARGNYRGIGLSTWVEICGLAPSAVTKAIGIGAGGWESSIVRLHPTGSATVDHRLLGARPGPRDVRGRRSSRASSASRSTRSRSSTATPGSRPYGLGTYGSRSLAVGGTALQLTLREGARQGAPDRGAPARVLGRRPRVGGRAAGRSRARPSAPRRSRSWPTPPGPATRCPTGVEPNLEATTFYDPPNFTFPFGTHIAEVEIDGETGKVAIERYIAVDDCGNVINPMIVDGPGARRHRAVDRAGALRGDGLRRERPDPHGHARRLHDPVGGRAAALRLGAHGHAVARRTRSASRASARRARSRPARRVVNAAVDALSGLGVRHLEMPMQPARVWEAIQQAKAGN